MSYNVLLFTEENKPDTETLLTISDRIKDIYHSYTKTISGNMYVVVSRKQDVLKITAFCYGIRELWNIIKERGKS